MATHTELQLECSAIAGHLVITAATITEAISRPTSAVVHLVSRDDLDLDGPVGKPAHLSIVADGVPVRHFHLVVTAFRFDGVAEPHRRYTVELAHEISLLSLRTDVRMFQEKDAKEIASAVFDGAGVPADHLSWSVQRTLTKRIYCVQYRESDLNFVSRLLEHEGIFYFAHDDESSTHVTLADAQSAFSPIEGTSTCPILEGTAHGHGVYDFELETIAGPNVASVGDYNYETPGVELIARSQGSDSPRGERFEYTTGHQTQADGDALAKIRCEELLAAGRIGVGRSDRTSFRAGATFELEGPSSPGLWQKYLLTEVRHRIIPHPEQSLADEPYENRFTCIPAATTYRPPRRAVRPRLRGGHSVVVTGPGGEIHTDKLGRMKGKFFWDRVGAEDDKSSCWIRVVQLPIGGSMALARMTWEMSIAYFDGDPDRPVAVNRLYNAEKTSPYSYPGAANRMSLQTPTSPSSGKSNEIRMSDGGGGQEFFLNSTKDFDGLTINNKTETVAVDEKVQVGVDSDVTVGANQSITIGANQTTTVASNQGIQVTGDRSVTIGASETCSISGSTDAVITGSDTETTAGGHTTIAALGIDRTSKSSYSLTVGGSFISAAGLGVSMAVLGAKSETIGAAKIAVAGKTVTETVVGALASTVGGVCVHAAGANRMATTKGASAVTVGGVVSLTGGGKVSIKAKKVSIKVGGVANFLGGGGVLNLTPGSAAFVGLVTLDASGSIKLSGNPNLVG